MLAPYKRVQAQTWTNLRVTTEHQCKLVPTIGGLLLFGKDRFTYFPDSWVQMGRFAGTNRARLVDALDIRSHLPLAAEEAITFTKKHLTREAII